MKQACKICGKAAHNSDICEKCEKLEGAINNLNNYKSSICETCGKRGREINVHGHKSRPGDTPNYLPWEPKGTYSKTLCYYCYHKFDFRKGYKVSSANLSVQELKYLNAIERFYLVPLFYGDEPDLISLSKAYDEKMGIVCL